MIKKTLLFSLIVSLSLAVLWRPIVPAVLEDERVSFFSVEIMPMALPETVLTPPQKIVGWLERMEERSVVRSPASYLVTSYERPPPWRG
jgi:hypothetical protein